MTIDQADVIALMDRLGRPSQGPCGFCGHPDARHRVADAIVERVAAGEPADSVLSDYGLHENRPAP